MGIKTFPIIMTEEEHTKLKKAARIAGMSMKEYIISAINAKMKG